MTAPAEIYACACGDRLGSHFGLRLRLLSSCLGL